MITKALLDPNPYAQFLKWYEDAVQSKMKLPDAMTLATATKTGIPSARVVLYKSVNEKGFCFFTNYQSRKANELDSNPHAALVFHWPLLDRQIRIEGKVERVSKKESDLYWTSRPRESCLSALASDQSSTIPDRNFLEIKFHKISLEYEGREIPRPDHWGGYCLIPKQIEFWISGSHRLHDRFCYLRKGDHWELTQLSP